MFIFKKYLIDLRTRIRGHYDENRAGFFSIVLLPTHTKKKQKSVYSIFENDAEISILFSPCSPGRGRGVGESYTIIGHDKFGRDTNAVGTRTTFRDPFALFKYTRLSDVSSIKLHGGWHVARNEPLRVYVVFIFLV